jgi:hypothetical protein
MVSITRKLPACHRQATESPPKQVSATPFMTCADVPVLRSRRPSSLRRCNTDRLDSDRWVDSIREGFGPVRFMAVRAAKNVMAPSAEPKAGLLVLVDVKWSSWRGPMYNPGTAHPWKRHFEMLGTLLRRADGTIDANLRHEAVDRERLDKRLEELGNRDRRLVQPIVDMTEGLDIAWRTGSAAGDELRLMRDGLARCDELLNTLQIEDEQLIASLLNLFTCRVYLRGEQLARLHGSESGYSGGPGIACLDFRFQWHGNNYWLYAYLSLWSGEPASNELSPSPAKPPDTWKPVDLPGLRKAFEKISNAFSRECLYRYFPPVDITVNGQEHLPPRFWVVSALDADRAFRTDEEQALDGFCEVLLDAAKEGEGVADGLLAPLAPMATGPDARPLAAKYTRVLRRFLPGTEVPAYLIVPNPDASPIRREAAVDRVIRGLTDIETGMAAELFDQTTDLETDETLIEVYRSVQRRAAVLWDQLAMFLPDAKGTTQLDRVHRLIQLIHLILLQGIADLDWVLAQTESAAAVVTEERHQVRDRFDKQFTERPVGPTTVLEGVLTSGYLSSTERVAERTSEAGTRVRGAYQSLIDGIGGAYDDRRVRHTDQIGLFAVLVAVGLAGIGLLTETYSLVLADRSLLMSGSILVALVLVFGALSWAMWIKWFRNIGEVATLEFTPRYQRLRAYLSNCRTDRLTRIRERELQDVRRRLAEPGADIDLIWQQYYASWDRLDSDLTLQLAALLDSFELAGPSAGLLDLSDVLAGIERWLQVGMLVSERPRSFSGFPLPRLMLLYRLYPILRSEMEAGGRAPGRLVADSDMFVGLRVHCNAKYQHIGLLTRWGRHAIRLDAHGRPARSAMAFRADIAGRLGIRAGMTSEEWDEALERMRIDEEPTRDEHPDDQHRAPRPGLDAAGLAEVEASFLRRYHVRLRGGLGRSRSVVALVRVKRPARQWVGRAIGRRAHRGVVRARWNPRRHLERWPGLPGHDAARANGQAGREGRQRTSRLPGLVPVRARRARGVRPRRAHRGISGGAQGVRTRPSGPRGVPRRIDGPRGARRRAGQGRADGAPDPDARARQGVRSAAHDLRAGAAADIGRRRRRRHRLLVACRPGVRLNPTAALLTGRDLACALRERHPERVSDRDQEDDHC